MLNKIIFIISLLPLVLSAQNATDVLERVQSKFQSLQNFEANFIQSADIDSQNGYSGSEGYFYYKKGNKFRVDLGSMIIVSDGKTLWNYNESQNRVLINYVEDDASSFSIEKYIMEYPSRCDVKLLSSDDKTKTYLLQLIPKDLDLEFNSIKLWINGEDLLNQLELVDLNDMTFTVRFQNIKINQKMNDSKFTFTPPKGSQIIDLR